MENYLVVLILSVFVLLGAFYVNTVQQRRIQIKDELHQHGNEIKKVKEELESSRKAFTEAKVELESTRNELKQAKVELDSTIEQIKILRKETTEKDFARREEIYQIRPGVIALREELNEIKKEIKNKPTFFAFLKSNTFFSGDDVLKFDEVTTNIGQNYNPSTGVFTTPKEGVYQISCVMVAGGKNDVHYWLYKNEERFSYGYTSQTAHANSNTQNWILELKKGDRVFIQHRMSIGQKVHSLRHSYFSGHLLY